jgi:hypothetical protein
MSDATVVKVCCRCSKELPVTEFAKCSRKKDGLETRCRQCESARQKERAPRSYQQNAEIFKRATREHAKRHPEVRAANHAVWLAVKSGRLAVVTSLTCQDCGQQAVHYHHVSYAASDRLNVVPLCHDCHVDRHRRY